MRYHSNRRCNISIWIGDTTFFEGVLDLSLIRIIEIIYWNRWYYIFNLNMWYHLLHWNRCYVFIKVVSLIRISGITYLVRIDRISDKICLNLIWNNNWSHKWWVVDHVKIHHVQVKTFLTSQSCFQLPMTQKTNHVPD